MFQIGSQPTQHPRHSGSIQNPDRQTAAGIPGIGSQDPSHYLTPAGGKQPLKMMDPRARPHMPRRAFSPNIRSPPVPLSQPYPLSRQNVINNIVTKIGNLQ